MGRTRELARATLDTADHFLVFGTLPVLHGSKLSQQVRLKAHRTGTDALGTADTGVGLLAEGLFTGNDGHGVGSLADGHLDTGQGLTHHRTTCQQLVVALGHTATSVDEILHRSTHTNEEVARVLQLLTGHGGIALEQGLVLHHGLVDGEGSAHILYDSTYVDRNSWGSRYLTTDNGVNQLLLTTLRIALLQGHYLDVVCCASEYLGTLLGQQFDSGHLVGLDTDIAGCHLGTLHEEFKTYQYLVGMLHHQTEVGGDIGLALYGIDDDALSLCRGRRTELDKGGETSTTHTYDTCHLDALHDFLGSQLGMVLHQFQLVGTVDALFPLVTLDIDDDDGLAITGSIDSGVNLENGTADTTEDRG